MTKLFSTFLALATAILSLIAPTAPKEKEYPLTAVVVELNTENDIVVCEDYAGNTWEFFGVEDWIEGDIASMIVNDKGTTKIKDDEIVLVRYGGWIGSF